MHCAGRCLLHVGEAEHRAIGSCTALPCRVWVGSRHAAAAATGAQHIIAACCKLKEPPLLKLHAEACFPVYTLPLLLHTCQNTSLPSLPLPLHTQQVMLGTSAAAQLQRRRSRPSHPLSASRRHPAALTWWQSPWVVWCWCWRSSCCTSTGAGRFAAA